MNQKVFRGKDLKEALGNVRREIGEDAMILSTRQVNGRFGPFGAGLVEVVAAEAEAAAAVSNVLAGARAFQAYGANRTDSSAKSPINQDFNDRIRPIEQELRRLRSQLLMLDDTRQVRSSSPLAAALECAGLSEQVARDLAHLSGAEHEPIEEALQTLVKRRLPLAGAIGSQGARLVALVGPAGVGKSTTIAKLAANAALVDGKSCAVISIDTHRAGAVEQMRRYADLIGIPLLVASTTQELEESLRALGGHDLVFIDTAGRSQNELEKLNGAMRILRDADPRMEIHLTLQSTSSERHMRAVTSSFRRFAINRLLFTKLDETVDDSALVAVALTSNFPLSYWTNGQRIPEDIAQVSGQDFAARLEKATLSGRESPSRLFSDLGSSATKVLS